MIYDARQCTLGEGPLWHPLRNDLFWFDILQNKLLTKRQEWTFDMAVSAAGWVDHDTLLLASARGLHRFAITTGGLDLICPLEADNPKTRSNDGRADPQGGFWIGTMGYQAEPQAGAIYRYYRDALRLLYPNITIANAICFAPDGKTAYFTDTPNRIIHKVALDKDGWPARPPEPHIDLRAEDHAPDGAVVDAAGNLWNAQWGSARIAAYDPNGQFLTSIDLPARQATCPAFGGDNLHSLFCTSAADGLDGPDDGKTFSINSDYIGQTEHRVIL